MNKFKTNAQTRPDRLKSYYCRKLKNWDYQRSTVLKCYVYCIKEDRIGSRRIDEFLMMHFSKAIFGGCGEPRLPFKSGIAQQNYAVIFTFHSRITAHPYLGGRETNKYNQYDSMIHPLQRWLVEQGVDVRFPVVMSQMRTLSKIPKQKERKATQLYVNIPEGTEQIQLGT